MCLKHIVLTPSGSCLVCTTFFGTLYVWDTETGQCIHIIKSHGGIDDGIAFTEDGNRCVSTHQDRKLRIWDMDTGQCIHTLEGHEFFIPAVLISADGGRCISGGRDYSIRIWDMNTGECLHTIKVNGGGENVKIIEGGNRCINVTNDGTICVWDVNSGQCIRELTTLQGINLFGVDLSEAIISPPEYTKVLHQNGAVIEKNQYTSFDYTHYHFEL